MENNFAKLPNRMRRSGIGWIGCLVAWDDLYSPWIVTATITADGGTSFAVGWQTSIVRAMQLCTSLTIQVEAWVESLTRKGRGKGKHPTAIFAVFLGLAGWAEGKSGIHQPPCFWANSTCLSILAGHCDCVGRQKGTWRDDAVMEARSPRILEKNFQKHTLPTAQAPCA